MCVGAAMNGTFSRILRVFLLLGLCGLDVTARAQTAGRQHVVVGPGDVLGVIASRFQVTADEIRRWNELDGDRIRVGQQLWVAPDGAAVAVTEREQSAPGDWETITVSAGDTLGALALRHGVTVQTLIENNPGLTPDRIREGQALRVTHRGRRVQHAVERGENLSGVARRYQVSVRDILRWNPRLKADRVHAGAQVLVFTDVPESRSQSIGSPSAGHLLHPERLREHPAFVLRDPARSWGTLETVTAIRDGFAAVHKRDPDAPRVRVHDISLREGGHMDDHKSHQSGRDVDISYYQKRCGIEGCAFRRLAAADLDVARQWQLLRHWLDRDQLEAVFVDYALQAALYRHARSQGATREQLARWFQYPRGKDNPYGVIRHYPKHDDHMHVRFACHETDPECKAFRVW